ncbi:hypothetical protein [Streptomyces sp. LBL]|uniref:hypothetical protein n=1 Tax=Streptomyces sp. LBL TaxID=2940562 RepID=UPI002475D603|nr:hypothetical protein [Streptomyces sp. LBL]
MRTHASLLAVVSKLWLIVSKATLTIVVSRKTTNTPKLLSARMRNGLCPPVGAGRGGSPCRGGEVAGSGTDMASP